MMGANYYWFGGEHDGEHIGKLSAIPGGRVKFTWAADPAKTIFALQEAQSPEDGLIDDLGPESPRGPDEILHILANCTEFDYTLIGHVFS